LAVNPRLPSNGASRLCASSQRLIFTATLTFLSRFCPAWDRFHGRLDPAFDAGADASVSRLAIPSGSNLLDAVFVGPASSPAQSALLICHGIGETVGYWFGVQRLLAANGIASLVFDYSGYGRSSGWITARQCEQDAIAAFEYLRQLEPALPLSILGFSLGSGIAAAIIDRVPAHRLVLCAVFTSFKAAALSVGFPRTLRWMVPDIWRTEQTLKNCPVPVLIVHGDRDELFPDRMASDLHTACAPDSELIIVPRLSHNEPHVRPQRSYWIGIVGRFLLLSSAGIPAPAASNQAESLTLPSAPGPD
jgi:pimeloyl-ACP methyl ester carboxylesterase